MPWTLPLTDPATADPERAGGKGAALNRLLARGLPVPPGFVVLPDAMRAAFRDSGAAPLQWSDSALRLEAQRRTEAIQEAPLPAGLEEEVRLAMAALGEVAVAVRSSARDEDGAHRSAAGQYDTVLGVRGVPAVLQAIRQVWASVQGYRAAVYRARTGAPPFAADAAVLVQAMAGSEVAGVVFTADPFSGDRSRLVVEMAGTPAAVVGGASAVQRVAVSRVTGEAFGTDPPLDPARLAELCRLALAAESVLGVPADVEWAWSAAAGFAILQARPIIAAATRSSAHRRAGVIWTSRFSGERWTEPATPLGWSIIEPALARYTDWRWASRFYLRGSAAARLHAGTPYFNITIFRHLLFKTPLTPTPEFVLELFPAEEREEWRARRWIFPRPGLVLLVLAEALLRGRWRGHRFLWFTNPGDWKRMAGRIEATVAVAGADRHPSSFPAAFATLDRLLEELSRYVGVHVWSLLWANLFYQLLGVLLEKAGGAPLLRRRPALVAGDRRESMTLKTNAAVWRLAATGQEDKAVERAIADAPGGAAALAAVAAMGSESSRHFQAALEAFLERYGHRSRATWEVFSRRWRDDPALVMEMVRACLRGGISADPFLREEEMAAARQEAEGELASAVQRHPLRRALIGWALGYARVYSLLRENQRFVFEELMLAIGDLCRAAASLLSEAGRLTRAGDVVWLTLPEMRELAAAELSAPEAARRISVRAREAALAAGTWQPTFLFEEEQAQAESGRVAGRVLHGTGVSPGRVTGRVRIARSIEDLARLLPGEVLVVKASDPGWTPFFPHAAALVTELGGLLSHAAVVAREYGLPAVSGVSAVVDTLRDGERVTVDGDAGTISRES